MAKTLMHAPASKSDVKLSQILTRLIEDHPGEEIGPGDLAAQLGDRVWGGLLLIFASINLLPLPPGATTVTGIPLIFVSMQMAMGKAVPWFPSAVRKRRMTKASLQAVLRRFLPWEQRFERLLRPRLLKLTSHSGTRWIGAICLLLSVILWLPIPFGNHLPAFSMTVLALSLIYRDGALAIVGYAASCASLLLLAVVFAGTAMAALFVMRHYFP